MCETLVLGDILCDRKHELGVSVVRSSSVKSLSKKMFARQFLWSSDPCASDWPKNMDETAALTAISESWQRRVFGIEIRTGWHRFKILCVHNMYVCAPCKKRTCTFFTYVFA